ncbi:MAG: phosphoribosylglycinamide formyltransferase [Cytophagales bacterium]
MKRIVLFASGSGSNVENIANYFANRTDVQIEAVYCNNPEAYVIERCKKLGIPCRVFTREEFSKSDVVVNELLALQTDLVVLAGFLWLIPKNLVATFPDKIINIHPALLPKFGGKGMYGHHVHEAVVANKESESGITIHFVNEHYDEGKVIFQASCAVTENDTADDVAKKIHLLEYEHFPKVIDKLLSE